MQKLKGLWIPAEILQEYYKNIKNILMARNILKNYSLNDILKIRDFIICCERKNK